MLSRELTPEQRGFTVAAACVCSDALFAGAGDLEWRQDHGGAYFNAVMADFPAALLLMAVAPLVPWRKANPERLRAACWFPWAWPDRRCRDADRRLAVALTGRWPRHSLPS
jgi:hypothetical protein